MKRGKKLKLGDSALCNCTDPNSFISPCPIHFPESAIEVNLFDKKLHDSSAVGFLDRCPNLKSLNLAVLILCQSLTLSLFTISLTTLSIFVDLERFVLVCLPLTAYSQKFAERLTYLNVAHNKITSLSGVGKLSNLVILRCSSNKISDLSELGSSASRMNCLEEFWVSNNDLEDLGQIQHLTVITTLLSPLCVFVWYVCVCVPPYSYPPLPRALLR
jgi:hypothetical protein